jgi:hypothetical protein
MRRGRLLEPVAIQIIREERPTWEIAHNAAENIYYRDPARRLGATPDVIVTDPQRGLGVIQIKSVEASTYRRKWLVDGEPEVPLWIALQTSLEAHLVGASWAVVAPLVVSYGLNMPLIEVPLVDGVIDAMADRAAEFWRMVDEEREPTADYARDGGLIDRLYPRHDEGEEVDLTADNRIPALIQNRSILQGQIKAAQSAVEEIDAEVKAKMGVATVAHIAGGQRITWRTRKRAAFTSPPTSYRALTYPKPF